MCAYRQSPNLKHMLVKSNLSRIPTLVGNSKYMKPRCQVCDILDTPKKLQILGTSSTIQHGNYNCDSCDIIYLLMCSKCDSDNYIVQTSNRLRFRLNNHKRSIRDNSNGFSWWLFISTNKAIRLKIWDVLLSEATSIQQQTESFVNKCWYINSKHIQRC